MDIADENGRSRMISHLIDDDSGSGTQIWISDINKDGKPDIFTSNKKGTNLFIQE